MRMTWPRVLPWQDSRRLAGGSARRGVMVVAAAGIAVVCAGLLTGAGSAPAAAARAMTAAFRWGRAEAVPGLAALNKTGDASVTSLACWSVNNCTAGGYYDAATVSGTSTLSKARAFVVAERKGRWARAVQVPGLAAVNAGGLAQVTSVSCAPRGYCIAGGYYTDASGQRQGFVMTAVKGRWRAAVKVSGLAALGTGGSEVSSVSCPGAGVCAAAGSYTDAAGSQGFVTNQVKNVWGAAQAVPGLAALNTYGRAQVISVSCGSAGNCAAGGSYQTNPYGAGGLAQPFVASEQNGVWGMAEEVPGLAALNTYGGAQVSSVSCARDGYCAAGGYFTPATTDGEWQYAVPFVTSGSNGSWGTAAEWKFFYGDAVPNYIDSVSCPSAGNCTAVGYVSDYGPDGQDQAFAASQKNGAWGTPENLPGVRAEGDPTSLSCPSAGNCAAGGGYIPEADLTNGRSLPFVASQTKGRWASAELYPGTTALDKGKNAQVRSVSCPSAGHCTAAGFYTDAKGHRQAFVSGP